ncbi:hypothetical protein GOP47_0028541 [Adiantum capillus-veneris]|nr:hypothetical protein GOP47_0028541 [Adiantum capillus-veneris]
MVQILQMLGNAAKLQTLPLVLRGQVLALLIGGGEKARRVGFFGVSYSFKFGSTRQGYTMEKPSVVDGRSCLCSIL